VVHDLFEVYETDGLHPRGNTGLKQQCYGQDLAETKAAILSSKNPLQDYVVWNATQKKPQVYFFCAKTRAGLGIKS